MKIETIALVGADILGLEARGLRVLPVARDLKNLAACVRDADMVVEALSEQLEHGPVKEHVLREIDALARPDALIVAQRGPWLVEDFAELLRTPARLMGVHLPDPCATLVEVAGHRHSDPLKIEVLWTFLAAQGFTTLATADAPGGVVHRLAIPYFNEAIRLVEEGHPRMCVERAACGAFKTPTGPFAMMNRLGVPAVREAAEHLGRALGAFYAPPASLDAQADGGAWSMEGETTGAEAVIADRLWGVIMHVALDAISEHVTSPRDIDVGTCRTLGWARGPFAEMHARGPVETSRVATPVQTRYRLWAPAALRTMCHIGADTPVDASMGRC